MNIFKKIKQRTKEKKNRILFENVIMAFIFSQMRIELRKTIEKMIENGELKVIK